MSRFLLLFTLALVAAVRPGIARDGSQIDETAAVACQMLATSVLTGTRYEAKSVELCNANERCLNTKRFIEQHRKAVAELTCANAAKSSPPAARQFEAVYENACAMASTGILTGVVLGNLPDVIALCNENPNKASCRTTKSFIEQRNHGNSGGVTCR